MDIFDILGATRVWLVICVRAVIALFIHDYAEDYIRYKERKRREGRPVQIKAQYHFVFFIEHYQRQLLTLLALAMTFGFFFVAIYMLAVRISPTAGKI